MPWPVPDVAGSSRAARQISEFWIGYKLSPSPLAYRQRRTARQDRVSGSSLLAVARKDAGVDPVTVLNSRLRCA